MLGFSRPSKQEGKALRLHRSVTKCTDSRACETTQASTAPRAAKQLKEVKHLNYGEHEKHEEEAMQAKGPKHINQGPGKTVEDIICHYTLRTYPLRLRCQFRGFCVACAIAFFAELAASLGCCGYRGLSG